MQFFDSCLRHFDMLSQTRYWSILFPVTAMRSENEKLTGIVDLCIAYVHIAHA